MIYSNSQPYSQQRNGPGQVSPYRQRYYDIQDERRYDKIQRDEQRQEEKLRDFQVSLSQQNSSPQKMSQVPQQNYIPRAGGALQRQRSRDRIADTQDMMIDRRYTVRQEERQERQRVQDDYGAEDAYQQNQGRPQQQQQQPYYNQQPQQQQQQQYYNQQPQQQQQQHNNQQSEEQQQYQPQVYQNSSPTQSRGGYGQPTYASNQGSLTPVKPEVLALRRQMTVEMAQMQDEIGQIRTEVLRAQRSNEDLLRQVQRVEQDVIPREVDRIEDRIDQQNRTIKSINPVSPIVERRIANRVKNDLSEEFTDRQQEILREQDQSNKDLISQQQATQKMLKDLSLDLDLKEIKDDARHRTLQRTLNDMNGGREQNRPLSNAARNSLQNNFSVDNNQVYLPTTNNAFYSDVNTTPQQNRGYPQRRTPSSNKQQFNVNSSQDFSAPKRPATKDLYIEEWANTSINPSSSLRKGPQYQNGGNNNNISGGNPASRSRSGMNDYGNSPSRQSQTGIPQNLDILDTMVQNQRSGSKYY